MTPFVTKIYDVHYRRELNPPRMTLFLYWIATDGYRRNTQVEVPLDETVKVGDEVAITIQR